MDNLKLETQNENQEINILSPVPRPNPPKSYRKFVLVLTVALVGVIIVGSFCILEFRKKPTTPGKIVSNITVKNPAGIVLPTSGFPLDLLIEPNAHPTVNKTEYSADGTQITATREYQSQYDLYAAYQIAKGYLTTKKNWTVTEVIAPNAAGQGQTELKFSAQKDGYDATLDFKQSDALHALVSIIVKSSKKITN